MALTLRWLGHAGFKICYENTIIYIDPWKLKKTQHDADLILVSHSHFDHYSPDDIEKISKSETKLTASTDVITRQKTGQALTPGKNIDSDGVRIEGVPAYNPQKQFHPKSNNWLGFVVEVGGKRIYYAGDTDLTEEMEALNDIDIALLPVGGTYTMDAKQAADATGYIKPELAIPYHWGDIVGDRNDAEKFSELAQCDVKILAAGQTLDVD